MSTVMSDFQYPALEQEEADDDSITVVHENTSSDSGVVVVVFPTTTDVSNSGNSEHDDITFEPLSVQQHDPYHDMPSLGLTSTPKRRSSKTMMDFSAQNDQREVVPSSTADVSMVPSPTTTAATTTTTNAALGINTTMKDGFPTTSRSDINGYDYGQGSPDTAKINQKMDPSVLGYESGFSPDVAKNNHHQLQQHLQDRRQQRQEQQHQQQYQQHQQHQQHQQSSPPQYRERRPVTQKTHHTYDGSRVPRRSSLKASSAHSPRYIQQGGNFSNNNNMVNAAFGGGGAGAGDHPMTDISSSVSSSSSPCHPSFGRRNSMDTMTTTSSSSTTTNVMEVRIRGERLPVQRRRSIDFSKTVQVKEVQPVTQLNENVRELWLQADDFAAMKERRRSLLKWYKDREAAGETIHSRSYNRTSALTGLSNAKYPASSSVREGSSISSNINMSDYYSQDGGGGGQDTGSSVYTSSTSAPRGMMNARSEEENDSFRGLEKYIDKSGRRQKNMAWDSVLLEQDTQEVSGYFDEERIAELYKQQTSESPEKALARAAQDRAEVEEYLMSPRTTKLMQRTQIISLRRLSC
jgi:hypothetical protein